MRGAVVRVAAPAGALRAALRGALRAALAVVLAVALAMGFLLALGVPGRTATAAALDPGGDLGPGTGAQGPAVVVPPAPSSAPPLSSSAASEVTGEIVNQQAQSTGVSEIQGFLDRLNAEYRGYMPPLRWEDILGAFTGKAPFYDLPGLARGLGLYLVREVRANVGLMGRVVVLAVVCALLWNLQTAFAHEGTGQLAYYVSYLVMAGIAVGAFVLAIRIGQNVINDLVSLLLALLPLLVVLLAGTGAFISAGLLHPLMIFITNATGVVVKGVVFPLFFFAAVLDLAGSVAEGVKVAGLAAVLRQAGVALLGLLLTAFLGVMTVQGAAGAVADGVTLRTAKFMASSFVPVVGKLFGDASEMVIGSSLVLKNALGVAGAAVILLSIAFPVVKIVALVLVFRLAGAIVQPLSPGRIVEALNSIANSLALVVLCVGTVALMFFVGVSIVVAAGNAAVMLR